MSLHPHLSATLATAGVLATALGATTTAQASADLHLPGTSTAIAQTRAVVLTANRGPDGRNTGPRKACPISPLVAMPVLVVLPWPAPGPHCVDH